ncbi:MAG: helix-turn-helix domain-containing protein [Chloroflexi bacterium]|nr:helix-turn-helix domain-containing protein [Chloroflexota bacterium]
MPTRPNSKPLIQRSQLMRLPRLLDMMYRPAELAEELGIHVDTIYRTYIRNGLPHERQDGGEIYIHGLACAAWVRSQFKAKRKRIPLADGQAWCLRCRIPAPIEAATRRPLGKKRELVQAVCPRCGATINRIQRSMLPSPSDALSDGEGLGVGSGVGLS